jgi:hypothetical protein
MDTIAMIIAVFVVTAIGVGVLPWFPDTSREVAGSIRYVFEIVAWVIFRSWRER